MTAPLWSSGFRPFFLLGAGYAPLALAAWALAWSGRLDPGGHVPVQLWHGHEMLFGFSAAFICGFVLTALPSWAGTPEITGRPLMLLAGVWCAGRAAAWSGQWLPAVAIAALDLALLPLLAVAVLPGLLRARHRRYLALAVVLAALTAANAAYHAAAWQGEWARAENALLMALSVLVVMFAMVAGFLIPVFTETALADGARGTPIGFNGPLEAAAIVSVIAFAASSWPGIRAHAAGVIALAASLIHLARMLRWRTMSVVREPLVLAMHIAYGWLVVAMALRASAAFSSAVPPNAWVHAFSAGALGLMMLAIVNRVVLRHTGRALVLSPAAIMGLCIMLAAGLLRVGVGVWGGSADLLALSGIAWAAPFGLFLLTDAPKLWRPSLPRRMAKEATSL